MIAGSSDSETWTPNTEEPGLQNSFLDIFSE